MTSGDNEYSLKISMTCNKAYNAVQSLYVNCKLKAEFQRLSVCLMLLSSKNDEFDGIKTFEV